MLSGLLLFCTFLFSTFRYENAKQILYIFHLLIESQCRCFSVFIPSWQHALTKYSSRCKCLDGFLLEYEVNTKNNNYMGHILMNTILCKTVQYYKILTDHYAI